MDRMTSVMRLSVVKSEYFFFSSRRRHTRFDCDWSSDVCSSDLTRPSVLRLAGCGFLTGLALAAKHSGVLMFPILFLLAIAEVALGSRAGVETPQIGRASCRERV